MQENIFCKQCGKPGAKTDKFCKFCGEEINSDSIDSIPDENSQNINEDIISDEEDKLFVENNTRKFILASRLKRLLARLLDIGFGIVSALVPGLIVTFLTNGNFDPFGNREIMGLEIEAFARTFNELPWVITTTKCSFLPVCLIDWVGPGTASSERNIFPYIPWVVFELACFC